MRSNKVARSEGLRVVRCEESRCDSLDFLSPMATRDADSKLPAPELPNP